jgi:lysophospholipase L1-like esterase
VYILGDSITDISGDAYRAAFQQEGITAEIDAASTRGLNRPGTTGNELTGIQAIHQDQSAIRRADAVVVALGTNGGDTPQAIDQAVAAIRAVNSMAPIYWIDTIGVDSTFFPLTANRLTNQAIYQDAAKDGLRVISWFSAVDPAEDAESPTNPTDINGYISYSDNLHVHPTPAGVEALVRLVIGAVAR